MTESTTSGTDIGNAICRALGLAPDMVTGITLTAEAMEPATLEVRMIVLPPDQLGDIAETTKRYELVERTTDDDDPSDDSHTPIEIEARHLRPYDHVIGPFGERTVDSVFVEARSALDHHHWLDTPRRAQGVTVTWTDGTRTPYRIDALLTVRRP